MALSAFIAARAPAQPRLDIAAEQRAWDLADQYPAGLPVDKTAEHTFTLTNAGTEPVVIGEVTSAQPFLVIEVPKREIAPGKEVAITVTVNAKAMELSQFEAYIEVEWNNPAPSPKPLVLAVRGRVIPTPETLFLVTPREQNIGLVRVGETRTLDYEYENAGTSDFEVSPITFFEGDLFKVIVNIRKGPCPKATPGTFTLAFTPGPGDAGKEINEVFVIPTDAADQERVVCRVRGYVAERPDGVQVIPQFVPEEEGRDGTMSPPRANFRIVNNTDQTVEVVISRGDEELKRFTLRSLGDNYYTKKVESEEEFKELRVLVTPYVDEPEPEEPETGESEAMDEGTGEGEASDEEAVEGSIDDSPGPEVGPVDDGETPASSNEDEVTEPADVEG